MALQDDNFRDFLARRFSRRPAVISFVEQPTINLNEAELPNEGSTQDLWHAVLRLTKQMDTIQQLIAEVRRQFEKDAELIDKLAEAWLKGKESAPVAIDMRNPYPGLRPYEEADHDLFYGRERWIADLTKALDDFGFVTLYGGSGSGKSSLLRAGLMPRLKRAGHAVVLFTPGKNPFDSLLSMGLGNRAQAQALVESAQKGELPGLFAEINAQCFPGQTLLVIMDQGEELFTRCESAEVRETFLQCLFHARSQSPRILIGIREDFFDRWNKTQAHAPAFGATNLSLTPPDEGDWRSIILDPARKHGVIFQAGLPEVMIERLRVARAGLPLLQFLLQKLWEHDKPEDGVLNQESYDSLGGIDHALRGHVEAFLARYPGRESEIRQMLFKLVRFTRQDGQYRALSRSCAPEELPKDLTAAMMSDQWRILTTRGQAGEVEFSHEVLLRVWPGFEKLEQQRGALHGLKGDITDACARWSPTKQKSELWSGSRLEEALKRAGLPDVNGGPAQTDDFALAESPLSESERDFLQTSRAKVIADRKFRTRLLQAATVTAGIMLLIAAVAALYWKKAEEQTVVADNALILAKQEEARAEKLTRKVIIKSSSTRPLDEAQEVVRSLAQSPDTLKTWEGRFLAKRFGFAPMRLRKEEIGILDQGPFKDSGLYQAALDLLADKGGFDSETNTFKAHGITFEARSTTLDVTLDAGEIHLMTLATSKYGGFSNVWLAPDRSCFLLRSELLQMKFFELPHEIQASNGAEYSDLYVIPLPERYSCAALIAEPKEGEPPKEKPTFDYAPIQAGGSRHLFTEFFTDKNFHIRFESTPAGTRSTLEFIPPDPPAPETPLTEKELRLALPKEKLAAFEAWLAQGPSIHCIDWSKEEIEVGAYLDGHFLLGPASAPEKMKKLKLPNSPAANFWTDASHTRSLFLDFSADGKHLLAYPYQNLQIAIIDRESMKVERLISGGDDGIFEYVESRSTVKIGSNSTGSLIWASTVFKTDSETFLFRSGSDVPVWKAGSSIVDFDIDSTDRYFAQNMRLSNQFALRDGYNGPIVASASANTFDFTDPIREAAPVPGLLLLGETLLRREDLEECMQMPKGITLAPDWSWAAYLENASQTEVDYAQDIPFLRILHGLNETTEAQTTLADKALHFQLQWFSSPKAQKQLQSDLSQTFEAREKDLLKRFGWPKNLPMATLERFEALRKNAPAFLEEAKAMLQERPSSNGAQLVKAVASYLITENLPDAEREIATHILQKGDFTEYSEPKSAWGEFASYMSFKGGKLPQNAPLEGAVEAWSIIGNLQSPQSTDISQWVNSFSTNKSQLLAQLISLSYQAHTQGNMQAAHQFIASIPLLMNPPAWFTASVQARSLVKDPTTMLLWVPLGSDAFMTALNQIFQTLPPKADPNQSVLALASSLFAHSQSQDLAQNFTKIIQSVPGLELDALKLLLAQGIKVELNTLRFPDDASTEMQLAWIGRLALEDYADTRQKAHEAKFAALSQGRPLQQLTDTELRSHLCLLIATLTLDDPASQKWTEAKAALQLLQTRQPALRDLETLKNTSWTDVEAIRLELLINGPPKQ